MSLTTSYFAISFKYFYFALGFNCFKDLFYQNEQLGTVEET